MIGKFHNAVKITGIAAVLSAVLVSITLFIGANSAAAKSPYRSLDEAAAGLVNAFENHDFQKISAYMAQDVIAMYPNATLPVIGREANRETWKQAFQIYESHPLTVDHVFAANSRDIGYCYGRWAASGVPGVGEVAGRYIVTWAWTKSGWQIIHISAHIHEDVPPSDILVQ
jgi:ketosteroid isomerase-like protein